MDVVVVAGIPPDTAQLKVELEPSGTSTVFPDSPVKGSPLIVRTGSFEEGSEIIEFSAATFYIWNIEKYIIYPYNICLKYK